MWYWICLLGAFYLLYKELLVENKIYQNQIIMIEHFIAENDTWYVFYDVLKEKPKYVCGLM